PQSRWDPQRSRSAPAGIRRPEPNRPRFAQLLAKAHGWPDAAPQPREKSRTDRYSAPEAAAFSDAGDPIRSTRRAVPEPRQPRQKTTNTRAGLGAAGKR